MGVPGPHPDPRGGAPPGFLHLVRKRVRGLDGRTASVERMKGPASGAIPSSGGVSRESGLNGPVATGRGDVATAEPVFPGPRVSPRAGGPFRGFRKGGPGSRRAITGATPVWFVPLRRKGDFSTEHSGRRLSGRGKPRGSGETQASNGNGKGRSGRLRFPSLGAAAPSGAPAAAAGIASLPGDAMIV
jgi:hypothetical protein